MPYAEVYFGATRTRHRIELTPELEQRTVGAVAALRADAARTVPPPPLVDSPKCPRCSLVGICLPDEVNILRDATGTPRPRRLVAADSPTQPLYATTPGSRVTKRAGRVVLVERGEEVASRRLLDISHIAVFGNVDVGSALLRECFDAGIPVLWLTMGGWLSGVAFGMPSKNVRVRMRQHRAAAVGAGEISAAIVAGKLRNQRTLLRRHGDAVAKGAAVQIAQLAGMAERERNLDSLLGIEGTAARLYFERFGGLLKATGSGFAFAERNRRPPRDPVIFGDRTSYRRALEIQARLLAAVLTGSAPAYRALTTR